MKRLMIVAEAVVMVAAFAQLAAMATVGHTPSRGAVFGAMIVTMIANAMWLADDWNDR